MRFLIVANLGKFTSCIGHLREMVAICGALCKSIHRTTGLGAFDKDTRSTRGIVVPLIKNILDGERRFLHWNGIGVVSGNGHLWLTVPVVIVTVGARIMQCHFIS